MKLNRDLGSRGIFLKGFLFAVMVVVASALNLLEDDRLLRGLYLVLVIWSSARLYYFMFYVVEKYVDPGYRFAGVADFLRYLARRGWRG